MFSTLLCRKIRVGSIPHNWESYIMIPKDPKPKKEPVQESIPTKESILSRESILNRESIPIKESILTYNEIREK